MPTSILLIPLAIVLMVMNVSLTRFQYRSMLNARLTTGYAPPLIAIIAPISYLFTTSAVLLVLVASGVTVPFDHITHIILISGIPYCMAYCLILDYVVDRTKKNHYEQETMAYLVDKLGPTLVAVTAATRDRTAPSRWMHGTATPTPQQMERLRVAREVFDVVAAAQGDDMARQWFIGMNVGDDNTSPCEALNAGRYDEVRVSARNCAIETWS